MVGEPSQPKRRFCRVSGLALNGVVTGVIVIAISWFPLRSVRLVATIAVNLAAGLGEGP